MITAVALIVVIALMIAALGFLFVANQGSSTLQSRSEQAYFIARSGIEYAKQRFFTGTACGALGATQPVGNGSFTVTAGTLYNVSSATVAAGGVNNTQTTLPVSSTAGYAPFGRILVDNEEMYYGGISGNSFVNVVRGFGNTAAATHSAGAVVVQALCNLQSIGTVGGASRTLQANLPLQNFEQGVFNVRNGTGAQSITGVGFRPNAMVFFWTQQTGTGTVNNASAGIGMADASGNQYSASIAMRNGQNPSVDQRVFSTTGAIVIYRPNVTPPTIAAKASLQSMDADGFTLNWTTNSAQGAGVLVYYIAIGGSTDGKVGVFAVPNTTGSQSVTGIGFQPNFVLFANSSDNTSDNSVPDSELGIGFARSASARGAMVYASHNGVTSLMGISPRWQQLTDHAILFLDQTANPPTAADQADFVSMDADGFTVNWTAVRTVPNRNVGFLALRGARADTGAFNQPTATGNQTPVAALAYQPNAVVLASDNLPASTGLGAGRTAIGAGGGSPISNSNIWVRDLSGALLQPSNTSMHNDVTNLIVLGNNANNTAQAQAVLSSLNLGGFTLNWTAADATARQILYWTLGSPDFADIREIFP